MKRNNKKTTKNQPIDNSNPSINATKKQAKFEDEHTSVHNFESYALNEAADSDDDYDEPTDIDENDGYHAEWDSDYDEDDDVNAGRQGAHTTRTGSTNNSRFGGKQQYGTEKE